MVKLRTAKHLTLEPYRIRAGLGPLVAVNRKGHAVGETHHRAKLSDADIDLILELHDAGLGYARIAAKMDHVPGGISKSHVRYVCKAVYRAQTPERWKRAEVPVAALLSEMG